MTIFYGAQLKKRDRFSIIKSCDACGGFRPRRSCPSQPPVCSSCSRPFGTRIFMREPTSNGTTTTECFELAAFRHLGPYLNAGRNHKTPTEPVMSRNELTRVDPLTHFVVWLMEMKHVFRSSPAGLQVFFTSSNVKHQ